MIKQFSIPKYILWPLYFCSVILITISIVLTSGIYWLSSESGQKHLQNIINNKLSYELGYKIDAKEISFHFPLNTRIANVSLSDENGKWVEIHNISLNILPTPNIYKHITISNISIDQITLLKTPNVVKNSTTGNKPDLKVSILEIDIKRTIIDRSITTLNNNTIFSIKGSLKWASLEQKLSFKNSIHLENLAPNLESLEIVTSGTYLIADDDLKMYFTQIINNKAKIDGSMGLNFESRNLSLDATIKKLDLAKWTTEITGNIELNLKINGTIEEPVFHAFSQSSNIIYNQNDIPDITASLNGRLDKKRWIGDVLIKADELRTSLNYVWLENDLQLNNIYSCYYNNSVSGNIKLNTNTMLIDGRLHTKISNIEQFVDSQTELMEGNINILSTLSSKNGIQTINAIADISRIKYQDFIVSNARFTASHNNQNWDIDLETVGKYQSNNFKLNTSGTLFIDKISNLKEKKIILNILKGSYGTHKFFNTDKIILISNDEYRSVLIPIIEMADGRFSLSAKFKNELIDVNTTAEHIPLSLLEIKNQEYLIDQYLKYNIKINGTLKNPEMNLDLSIYEKILDKESKEFNNHTIIQIKNGEAHFSIKSNKNSSMFYNINGKAPINFSFQSPVILSIKEHDPIKAELDYNIDLSTLSNIISLPEHDIKGKLYGALMISGNASSPIINGEMKYNEGMYEYFPFSLQIRNISTTIFIKNNFLTIPQFIAEDYKKNTLNINGSANFTRNNNYIYNFKIDTKNFHLINHPNVYSIITGDTYIKGNSKSGVIEGSLNSERLDIYLPDEFTNDLPKLNITKTISKEKKTKQYTLESSYPITLNITLQALNKVFIRGWGVDAELSGKIELIGPLDKLKTIGKLSTVRGRYEEFGKQFKIKKAELIFDGNVPPSPYLNIIGSTTKSGIEINPSISGPIIDPVLGIESSPSKPQEEILSLLLFGKDSSKINTLQAIQLANSLKKLSTRSSSGFDPIRQIRDLFGLDDISLNESEDSSSGPSIGAQKYLTDTVRVKAEQGEKAKDGKVGVEADLTPNISVESGTSITGNNGLGLNWKYNY